MIDLKKTGELKLFDKYYSRRLLAAAGVLADLHGAKGNTLSWKELERKSRRYSMTYELFKELMKQLEEIGLILWQKEEHSFRLTEDWGDALPQLPPSAIEEEYLQWILQLPQAALFLPESLRQQLREPGTTLFRSGSIETLAPKGEQSLPALSQREFCCILEAIARGCAIRYQYKTKTSRDKAESVAVPWRLEYSAFDNRWWIILYVPGRERPCVKAWLGNLSQISLDPRIRVPETEIVKAREKLLMPEPMVLHIKDTRNALERCFLVLEKQQFSESVLNEDGSATLSFRYYQFEESDLLRKLLYLGPAVELKRPAYLRQALLRQVEQALKNFDS